MENQSLREQARTILQQVKDSGDDKLKRAYGCLLGSFIGDSIGSYLEFRPQITRDMVIKAMKQERGGTFGLEPGQLTDDSEMALSLAYGLIKDQGKFDLDNIGEQYIRWLLSNPFDIGMTTQGAINIGVTTQQELEQYQSQKGKISGLIMQNVEKYNQESQSNGCLMRITPLALYCLNLSVEEIFKIVAAEVQLTHCNKEVIFACQIWVVALVQVINTGSPKKSFPVIQDLIEKHATDNIKQNWWNVHVLESKVDPSIFLQNIGWAKIAWTFGLKQLHTFAENEDLVRILNYYSEIEYVISLGGDTDTNACIIGGMFGAMLGLNKIENQFLENLIQCDVSKNTKPQNRRPEQYQPYNAVLVCQKILEIAPKSENIN